MLQDDHDPEGKPLTDRTKAGIPRGPALDHELAQEAGRGDKTDAPRDATAPRVPKRE